MVDVSCSDESQGECQGNFGISGECLDGVIQLLPIIISLVVLPDSSSSHLSETRIGIRGGHLNTPKRMTNQGVSL